MLVITVVVPSSDLMDGGLYHDGCRGVKKEQIFLGVGSDEAIDILMRVFCEPGVDKILVTPLHTACTR